MITFNWCNDCSEWLEFHKEGRNPQEGVPWKCTECGHEATTFPEYDNPITWVLTGRRPK